MKNKYLGLICLLYSFIIIYAWKMDKLKNYLSPQLQIYLKIAFVMLFIFGIITLLSKRIDYKFKISDIVLILPLIMFIISGNGRLSSTFASNRMVKYNQKKVIKKNKEDSTIISKEEVKDEITNEEDNTTYDMSNIYFDIKDDIYAEISSYITYEPKAIKYLNKTIRVRGFSVKNANYIPKGYFALGKYLVSCCAADAEFTGFILKYDTDKIKDDSWYEIEGILEKGKDRLGYDILYIKVVNLKEIKQNSEEQYVYPCYSYDNGLCSSLSKYELEY